jgi:tRNA modification GTPase
VIDLADLRLRVDRAVQLDLQRTIVALSSGLAPARRAIVRISGTRTSHILRQVLLPVDPSETVPDDAAQDETPACEPAACESIEQFLANTRARSGAFRCQVSWPGRSIRARVYYWPDERCFTGEPSAEIHLLGALPVVESLMSRLIEAGGSPASRGEFTLRSFLAGKLDLTQAEAILGVIEADTPQQLSEALEWLGGNLSNPVRTLRSELLELVAHLEAGLDFVEEDIEFISEEALAESIERIAGHLQQIAARLTARGSGSRTRQVVLVGLPNAGKSSLFNALLGSERAIVTEQAGTTRDAISETLVIDGMPLELIDTAGIEQIVDDTPRHLAQSVVAERLSRADAILFCMDLSDTSESQSVDVAWQRCRASGAPAMSIGTKCDLLFPSDRQPANDVDLRVSAHWPDSVNELKQRIVAMLGDRERDSQSATLHRAAVRCKSSIDLATAALQRALVLLADQMGEELVAAELRCSLEELAAVIGEVHTEDILGEIFSRFCIGK